MSTKKIVLSILGFSCLFWGCKTQNMVPSDEDLPRVEKVHFNQKTNTVNVYYDLNAASSDTKFNIKLMLSLGENKTYEIDPSSTSGDIGEGVLPGKKKKISWNVLEDFPQGINGKEIQFIVNAKQINSSNNKWVYITSGALLLSAGAVLGYQLLQSGDSGLPTPPTRPASN